ncbi:MAG: AAA family ATPase [Ilumatobacteraceae bacterium]
MTTNCTITDNCEDTDVPPCWNDVHDAIGAGIDRLILYGPPGTGKTYAGLTVGDVGAGSFRLICTEEMTAADVTGHFMPTSHGLWTWVEGSVLRAWNGDGHRGGRVVADEIDRASGDVLALLLNMFDTHDSASWQHPETGDVRRPRPGFSVVMTTNVEELRLLPAALRDRFPVAIRIDRPHPRALARLSPHLRGPATASIDADENRRFSLRAFFAFDHLCRSGIDIDRSARLVFGECSPDILDALSVDAVDGAASSRRVHD